MRARTVSIPLSFTLLMLLSAEISLSRATEVSQTGEREWTISGKRAALHLRLDDLGMDITSGTVRWEMLPSSPGDLTVRNGSDTLKLSLKDAELVTASVFQYNDVYGISVALDRIPSPEGGYLDLGLRLMISMEGSDEDLTFSIIPERENTAVVECVWPRGFVTGRTDMAVVPFMQGMLLPGDWPKEVRLYEEEAWGRGLYMPWWGFCRGDSAILFILETPEDGGCEFYHPAGGPTHIEPRWRHSLGKMGYERKARICRIDRGDYVELAKRYRRYVMEKGGFISLEDKIRRTPDVKKLLGSPLAEFNILQNIQPDSPSYDEYHPERNHQLVTFGQRTSQVLGLAERGVKRLYIHVDGWGARGYDNLHPDVLPPCPEAGGWEGMRRMSEVCDSLGYPLALHDQYRDYYLDAPSYNPDRTIIQEDGSRPYFRIWNGGKQSLLCPRYAPEHVEMNHAALAARGIRIKGSYLDVFAVIPPDECYSPDHPVSRTECLKLRADCFAIIKRMEGITSSEEPADWAVPFLDLVSQGGHALDPDPRGGGAIGIPAPIFNLVYHDALIIPWEMGKDVWGIPSGDSSFLYGILNAGMPVLPMEPTDAELGKARVMCELHARVGSREMLRHEFIGGNHRKQRTFYSDGTTVSVDFDRETYIVSPPLYCSVADVPDATPPRAVNYPNPFNARTVIQFEMNREDAADVSIFNVLGQKVRALMNGKIGPGKFSVPWDGCDENGRPLSSGVYVARVRTGETECCRKLLLAR